MYGDTRVIRHLAHELVEQADDIRQRATLLLAEADATPWRGLSADAMRASACRHAAELRSTAALHDDAAAALVHHAGEVDQAKALIASIEAAVHVLVDGALDRLGDLAGDVAGAVGGAVGAVGDAVGLGGGGAADPVDVLLSHFTPPAAGHLGWLAVDLPGLSR
jgi:hypothetical protein